MCGWQAERPTWARVELPNAAARRHFVAIMTKMGLQIEMLRRPLTEELLATMETGMRTCAHIRVVSGTVVPLSGQVEAVDVEVMDADCVCIHDDDRGAPPAEFPRRIVSVDLELETIARQGMVRMEHEENGTTLASVIVRQLGTPQPPS